MGAGAGSTDGSSTILIRTQKESSSTVGCLTRAQMR